MVDQQDSMQLEKELQRLSESGATVYKLMEHASQVMSNKDKEAGLPYASNDASHQIYEVLLQQWNHFNTGNGMANMPPPEIIKPLASISVEKSGKISFGTVSPVQIENTSISTSGYCPAPVHYSKSFEPMITGIAIGAP